MQIEYNEVNGTNFETLPVGSVFEFAGGVYMKIDTIVTEKYSVKKTYNSINLMTAALINMKYEDSVREVKSKLVIY